MCVCVCVCERERERERERSDNLCLCLCVCVCKCRFYSPSSLPEVCMALPFCDSAVDIYRGGVSSLCRDGSDCCSLLRTCVIPPLPLQKKGGGGWFEVMGITMKQQEKTGTTRLIVTFVISNKTTTGVVEAGFAVIIMVLSTRCLLPQRTQLARVNRGN